MNEDFGKKLDSDLDSDLKSDIQGEVDFEGNTSANTPEPNPGSVNNIEAVPGPEQSPPETTEGVSPAEQTTGPPPSIPEPAPRKRLWIWILIGIFIFLLLGLGGAAFASYKGWINIGLGEFFGGISGNPYKAVIQTIEKSEDIKELEHSSNLEIKVRPENNTAEESNIQESFSSATVSVFTKLLDFPNKIVGTPKSSKVLGEYTSKTSTNFQIGFSGKVTEKAIFTQYKYKLSGSASMEMYNQYLEPFANSDNEIVLDSTADLEKNNIYIKISSLEVEENPWTKISIPESTMPKEETFNKALQEELEKLEKINIDDYKDLFKEAKNLGVESIDGHLSYHFQYVTNTKKLTELYQKIYDIDMNDAYGEEDFDIEINLWIGVFDRFLYKFGVDFATQESSVGSMTMKMSTTLDYHNISVDIPKNSDCVDNICESALKDIGIVKEFCENPLYRNMFSGFFSIGDTGRFLPDSTFDSK